MTEQDPEILLGRLAVHYKIVPKERMSEAIRLWKSVRTGQDLGEFLVAESYLAPEALKKLLRARSEYLRRLGSKAPEAVQPVAPPAATPATPAPEEAAAPAQVGAATVRLTPDMLAQVRAAPPPAPDVEPEAVPAAALETAAVDSGELLSFESVPTDGLSPSADPTLVGPPDGEPVPAAPAAPPEEPMLAPETLPESGAPPGADPVDVEPLAVEGVLAEAAPAETVVEPAASVVASPDAEEGEGPLGYIPGVSTLQDLLRRCRQLGVSDLHVHGGSPLKIRVHGAIHDASRPVEREEARRILYTQLSEEQQALIDERMQLDFSFPIEGVGRFRSNVYLQHRGLDGVFRVIPPDPPTLSQLGLPDSLARFADYHQGIVLFTGPAGSGKSSTMAAVVKLLNGQRPDHILTVEDPIEYVHVPDRCVVNQREIGPHTESFARALRAALREDPDIIVIGELRDLETISLALTAAETGHLVLATLHTASTIPTINRLIGVFPPEQQAQIRTMVSESLRAVITQRLVTRADGQGRVPALEILVNNKAIGNLIRDNRTFQIKSILQTGAREGMCMLDSSLDQLVKQGVITRESAQREAIDPKKFT